MTAMENLFAAMRVATGWHIGHYRKKFLFTEEEWDEIGDEVVLYGVNMFLRRKIGQHKYCRHVSFLANCWSCVMSCFLRICNAYKNHVVKMKLCQDLPNDMKNWPPYSKEGYRVKATRDLKNWINRSMDRQYLDAEDEEDAMSYIECCEECGLPVDPRAPMFRRILK